MIQIKAKNCSRVYIYIYTQSPEKHLFTYILEKENFIFKSKDLISNRLVSCNCYEENAGKRTLVLKVCFPELHINHHLFAKH